MNLLLGRNCTAVNSTETKLLIRDVFKAPGRCLNEGNGDDVDKDEEAAKEVETLAILLFKTLSIPVSITRSSNRRILL